MKFVVELTRPIAGGVTGRVLEAEDKELVLYEVTVLTDDTKVSQTRVLRDLARHLNWFVDLSEGGTK